MKKEKFEKVKKDVEKLVGKKDYYIDYDFDMIYFIEKETEINFAVFNINTGKLIINK